MKYLLPNGGNYYSQSIDTSFGGRIVIKAPSLAYTDIITAKYEKNGNSRV